MMKLHYIDEYKEVDISEIVYRIFEIRDCEEIEEFLSARWNSLLISAIDDAIIDQLEINETTNLEDTFCEEDLTNIREEVTDRLRYLFS